MRLLFLGGPFNSLSGPVRLCSLLPLLLLLLLLRQLSSLQLTFERARRSFGFARTITFAILRDFICQCSCAVRTLNGSNTQTKKSTALK